VPLLRLDRTGAAVLGAALMIVTGAIPALDALRALDLHTLVLLASMMVIVAHLRLAGGLDLLARAAGARVVHPGALLVLLVVVAGVLSAVFINDTICLVFTPLVLDLAEARRVRPTPYLLALAAASNVGSAATPTGNPQNILIGSLSGLSFPRFVIALGPVSLAGLAIVAALVWTIYRMDLRLPRALVAARVPQVRHRLLVTTVLVMTCVLAGFVAGYSPARVAASGAAALVATGHIRLRRLHTTIDWHLLLLFAGLFIIVAAGERAGIDDRLFEGLAPLGVSTVAGLSATAALLSNAVSNVPAVMLLASLIPRLPDPDTSWLALAMSSTMAGNLTVLGSIANLIVIEGARRRGVTIGAWEYARVGMPVTLVTLACGVWWLS
jgi:Na+/H+ antiporter NhaD/arsenite permease-like protein